MQDKILYGANHNEPIVAQFWFPLTNDVQFFNWSQKEIDRDATFIVAVWRVKRLKPKPVINTPPFLVELN